jgi:hypothetical protein
MDQTTPDAFDTPCGIELGIDFVHRFIEIHVGDIRIVPQRGDSRWRQVGCDRGCEPESVPNTSTRGAHKRLLIWPRKLTETDDYSNAVLPGRRLRLKALQCENEQRTDDGRDL